LYFFVGLRRKTTVAETLSRKIAIAFNQYPEQGYRPGKVPGGQNKRYAPIEAKVDINLDVKERGHAVFLP
jgi:hypothetical protein